MAAKEVVECRRPASRDAHGRMRISRWWRPGAAAILRANSSKRPRDHRGSRPYAARFQETRLRQVQAAEPLCLGRPGERAASLLLLRDGHDGGDRKSVVSGKSVSVRVDLGGRRIIKKKNHIQ